MTDLGDPEALDEKIRDTVRSMARQARLVEELQSVGHHSAAAEDAVEALALRLEELNEDQDFVLAGAELL